MPIGVRVCPICRGPKITTDSRACYSCSKKHKSFVGAPRHQMVKSSSIGKKKAKSGSRVIENGVEYDYDVWLDMNKNPKVVKKKPKKKKPTRQELNEILGGL